MSQMHTKCRDDQIYASIDLLRAIVSAFSWRDDSPLTPVSTLAVQHELSRRNRTIAASDVLSALATVRDVQRIHGGYWLPSPTYLAISNEFSLVVSGLPSQQLKREYNLDACSTGFGRLLKHGHAQQASLPAVPLAEWLDAPHSTKQWTQERLQAAEFTPAYGMNSVEVFRSWKASSPGRWIRLDHVDQPNGALVLGRHQSPDRRANYYLLHLHENRPQDMHELPTNSDEVLRLMCGLRIVGKDPVKCRVIQNLSDDLCQLRVDFLPRAEMRLLSAVGRIQQTERGEPIIAQISRCTLNDVLAVLTLLGCDIEWENT